jgi:hypothetical protein
MSDRTIEALWEVLSVARNNPAAEGESFEKSCSIVKSLIDRLATDTFDKSRYEQALAKLRQFEAVTGEAMALISDLLPFPVDESTPTGDLRAALLACDDPVVFQLIKAAHRKGDGAMVLSIALLNVARLHAFAQNLAQDLTVNASR